MSRTLLLMRHAQAEDGHGVIDHDRSLTGRGREQAARVGRVLTELGHVPDHVICSTAERTRQTLDGVLGAMDPNTGADVAVDYSRSAYLAGVDELMELVNQVDADADTVLVVGHNPTIAQVAASFVGPEALTAFSPATVAAVSLEVEWLYAAPGTGDGRVLT
ncbi:SixA phosphatase family protein [Nocardiopsis sp. NPDC058789]|uniref:Histidine phosphatase family protein n=1 Tax=Nocardiopsis eucommiae TaxID=2831970 RepID=A0A975LAK4_9ACTN|nr:histidine phosphatase family protein [Nocardiopsis eucommiae]